MLVLTRKLQETVVVGGTDSSEPILRITIVEIEGGKVRLGFQADAAVRIHRLEVWQRMQNNVELNAPKPGTTPPDAASQAE